MKHRAGHIVEYLALRGLVGLLQALPYRAALSLGWSVAWVAHYLGRYRVASAKQRIRQVFGDRLSDQAVDRIAWLSWRNFIFSVVDMTRLPRVTPDWIGDHINGWDTMQAYAAANRVRPRGAVLATPHMGAWEVGGVALQKAGVPMFFFAARQRNPLVDDFINRLRGSTGVQTLEREGFVLREVIRRLRKGEAMGFLPDVRARKEALSISFLGHQANIGGGMALFARQAKVPIVLVTGSREGWTRHRFDFHAPIEPDPSVDKQADALRMTQEVFGHIERAIRDRPEQWFWYNKRWILDPLEPAKEPASPAPAD